MNFFYFNYASIYFFLVFDSFLLCCNVRIYFFAYDFLLLFLKKMFDTLFNYLIFIFIILSSNIGKYIFFFIVNIYLC